MNGCVRLLKRAFELPRACVLVSVVMLVACSSADGTAPLGESIDSNPDFSNLPTRDGLGVDPGIPCETTQDCEGAFELLPCERASCSEAAGVCEVGHLPDGTECADGLLCTGPDACLNGVCRGTPLDCDDGLPCTSDSCDQKDGCVHSPLSEGSCDDGDPCTTEDTCVDGACTGGSPVEGCCLFDAECDDGDLCTDDNCEDNTCVASYNFAPCNDEDLCTLQDRCDGAGGCGGEPLLCDDQNPCTEDTCDPDTGTCIAGKAEDGTPCEDGNPCTNPDSCVDGLCVGDGSLCQCTTDADCVSYEDGNLCNGTLRCVDFLCVVEPTTIVQCNPTGNTACVTNTCDPQTGQCVPSAAEDGTNCDDQNPCTDADGCLNGLCVGAPLDCDDENACTFDACNPTSGCVNVAHTQPCDDGDICTQGDQCQNAVCSGSPVECDDGDVCTDDLCSPGIGCTSQANNAPCDDGNACTLGDQCAEGVCTGGTNTCACTSDGDCASEEDGNICNGTLRCVDGECQIDPSTPVTCDASADTACVKNLCDAASGTCVMSATGEGGACDDGNACTSGDACTDGLCVGTTVECDDENPCTSDTCDTTTGCDNSPNTLQCDDGDPCTGNDKCSLGACNGVALGCDDGNPCTIDSCDAVDGCVAVTAQDGTPCDDGSICTVFDACSDGACMGEPADCDDENVCTADLCSEAQGCLSFPLVDGTPCDDGSACSQGDQCVSGGCLGNPPSCDDGDPCTLDICDDEVGCDYSPAPDGVPCEDGDPCTAPDACLAGECQAGEPFCGCQSDADCAAEDDDDLCNGTLMCSPDGTCKIDPSTIIVCPAGDDPCLTPSCTPETGTCTFSPSANGALCDDSDGCTINDTCQEGTCTGFPEPCDDQNPCTADSCQDGACTYESAYDGQPCADDSNPCTLDVCQSGTCEHPAIIDGEPCSDDGNSCTSDLCVGGECVHPPVSDQLPCADDGNPCTYDQCADGICQHVSNDPAPVGPDECFPVSELTANTGPTTNGWSDCGVADQFSFKCNGPNCANTGSIDTWPCANPDFVYDGEDTGYEYAYVFVAPSDGVCTLIEHDEGFKTAGGGQFGVIDWFILTGGGCEADSCIAYMWENVDDNPLCGPGKKVCSFKEFSVSEGQVFYIVADIYDGLAPDHEGFDYDQEWSVEIVCDASQELLLNEDFTDAVCDGCSESINAPPQCSNFGWHPIGGFADVVTGYYVGQLSNNTLTGYDCAATSAGLGFPTVTLPATSTSCTASFDYYAELDPADDGDCANDILEVMLSVDGGAATLIPGDACGSGSSAENPIGSSQTPAKQTMSYDISYAMGSEVTLTLMWSSNDTNNVGLGAVIDNVQIVCEGP